MKTIITFFTITVSSFVAAQCPFTPTISGDTVICPNGFGTLYTQDTYDSYQWYWRDINDSILVPFIGAMADTVALNYFDHTTHYFAVEVTDNGCTERSAEFFVDGINFLPLLVQTTGNDSIGLNGETLLCPGDTAFYTVLPPFDTLFTWYRDGVELSETGNTLAVTESGLYLVEAAPSECPSYIDEIGADLIVEIVNCATGIDNVNENLLNCSWNAESNSIAITGIPHGVPSVQTTLFSVNGKQIKHLVMQVTNAAAAQLTLPELPAGTYLCNIQCGDLVVSKKIVVVR